jgi:hypothetical protein
MTNYAEWFMVIKWDTGGLTSQNADDDEGVKVAFLLRCVEQTLSD